MALSDRKTGISALPLRHADIAGRLRMLREAGLLTGDAETGLRLMGNRTLLEAAELMDPTVENVIGVIPYQLGLATNFRVNGRETLVPMAVREPTIVAGMSKAAKLALPEGFLVEAGAYNEMTAEILFSGFGSREDALNADRYVRDGLKLAISRAESSPSIRCRVIGSNVLCVDRGKTAERPMLAIRIVMDVGDFQGARIATAAAQKIAGLLEGPAGCKATAVICSNGAAGRRIIARALWPRTNVGRAAVRSILDLQRWAANDPLREVTHDKGIMNAIMGVCRATGQDEEAIWAAMRPTPKTGSAPGMVVTKYSEDRDGLEGRLSMKMPVATHGGATREPFARMCRKLMGIEDSRDLAHVIGAAGLAANFAALYCLANEGILAAFDRVRQ